MTGMCAVRSSAASRRVAENPSRSAIFTSMKITSGRWRVARSIAFEAAGGGDHLQPGALEQAGQDPAADGAVVHHQRRHVLTGRQPGVERRARHACPSPDAVVVGRHQRQREVEPAAHAGRALHPQVGAHAAQQVLADGQAEARAAGRRAGLRLRERVEDLGERLRLDADAGVADLERELPVPVRAMPSRTSPSAGELDGVAEQVQQHLAHVAAVEHDPAGHVGRRPSC